MTSRLQPDIPGGPGLPSCAFPAIDALGPLGYPPAPNRGSEKTINPPRSAKERVVETVVDMRTWTDCVRGYPLVVTLGRKPARLDEGRPPVPELLDDALVLPRLRAKLTWGLGGGAVEHAAVDWIHGTQLSISAEYVAVAAEYSVVVPPWLESLPTPPFDPCDLPPFEVNAGIGYGFHAGTSAPGKRTEIVQIQHPTDMPVMIAVPPFATAFTVLLQSIGGGPAAALVEQLAFGTGYRTPHDFASPTANPGYFAENAIPFWNGAEFLAVTSKNPTDTPLVAFVVFVMAL